MCTREGLASFALPLALVHTISKNQGLCTDGSGTFQVFAGRAGSDQEVIETLSVGSGNLAPTRPAKRDPTVKNVGMELCRFTPSCVPLLAKHVFV